MKTKTRRYTKVDERGNMEKRFSSFMHLRLSKITSIYLDWCTWREKIKRWQLQYKFEVNNDYLFWCSFFSVRWVLPLDSTPRANTKSLSCAFVHSEKWAGARYYQRNCDISPSFCSAIPIYFRMFISVRLILLRWSFKINIKFQWIKLSRMF